MKLQKEVIVILFIGLCFAFSGILSPVTVQAADVKDPVLTVLNPLGTPPPIKLKAMAPRLDKFEGKTIYIENNGYPGTSILLGELIAVMKERYPENTFIYNDKPAGAMRVDQDPAAAEADAMIIATGH
jgi:hypothetical protein